MLKPLVAIFNWTRVFVIVSTTCLCYCFELTCHASIHPTRTVCCVLVDCSATNIPQTPANKNYVKEWILYSNNLLTGHIQTQAEEFMGFEWINLKLNERPLF